MEDLNIFNVDLKKYKKKYDYNQKIMLKVIIGYLPKILIKQIEKK